MVPILSQGDESKFYKPVKNRGYRSASRSVEEEVLTPDRRLIGDGGQRRNITVDRMKTTILARPARSLVGRIGRLRATVRVVHIAHRPRVKHVVHRLADQRDILTDLRRLEENGREARSIDLKLSGRRGVRGKQLQHGVKAVGHCVGGREAERVRLRVIRVLKDPLEARVVELVDRQHIILREVLRDVDEADLKGDEHGFLYRFPGGAGRQFWKPWSPHAPCTPSYRHPSFFSHTAS